MAIAVVLAAVGAAGCGSSGQPAQSSDETRLDRQTRTSSPKATFALTKAACAEEPRSEFAVQEGLPADASEVEIAGQYASEWPRPVRKAAFAGCIEGLAKVPARFPQSSPLAQDIWGRDFIVTAVGGDGETPPVRRPIQIRFSFSSERDHSVGWQARCNDFFGDAHVRAARIEVASAGSTEIGCEPAAEAEDEWLARFMEADPEWRLEGERLRLVSDRMTITLKDS